jgi:hypothetical protein
LTDKIRQKEGTVPFTTPTPTPVVDPSFPVGEQLHLSLPQGIAIIVLLILVALAGYWSARR